MKRFWTEVSVAAEGNGHVILLDARRVNTPGRVPVSVPTPALADAVAEEWRAVDDAIDPRAMPLTGLANAAVDRIAPARADFAEQLAAYAANDLLCYRASDPAPLVARQAALWDPILDWARTRFAVDFAVTTGIMHVAQPPETLAAIAAATDALDPFRIAALSPITRITGSILIALALNEGVLRPETAWEAAECDEDWQVSQWGEDELATRARADRRRDYDAAIAFLSAL